jgi:hypothetical protein
MSDDWRKAVLTSAAFSANSAVADDLTIPHAA